MSERVEGLRQEHIQLTTLADELCEAARALPMLKTEARKDIQQHLLRLLREHVSPHTWVDERVLYPEVTERLGDPLVTVSMNYDHQAIRSWIDDLAEVDVRNVGRVQQLLYGLYALIKVHTWKEDELYLAALDSASWPELQRR
jgi:hemerythrin-like domain-containing protein